MRSLPSPIPADACARLQGARLAAAELPAPVGPQVVQRTVSRGSVQVAAQQLRVGPDHSGKIVTVIVEATRFQVWHDGVPLKTFPRTLHQEVNRYKTYQAKSPRQAKCQGSTEPDL